MNDLQMIMKLHTYIINLYQKLQKMGTENTSIYQNYKGGLILLIVLIITFLVLTIYQDKKDYLTKDDLRMYDLKAERKKE
jgi:hypothetical protein